MNKLISFVLLLALSLAKADAQFARLDRYPQIPEEFHAAFVDQCKDYASGVANTPYGQYFGQITRERNAYGFGSFYTDRDGVVTGQFRLATFMFGIKMGVLTAKVGTSEHYTCYDLRTGDPEYIFKDSIKYTLPEDYSKRYRFEALNYQNGDKYIGETVDGERSGYGIYYYENGDYYYGRYEKNERKGYGALFRTNNTIVIQRWGEE